MSYAEVTAVNAPPASMQPRPNPNLLNTEPPTAPTFVDDTVKVSVVDPSYKEYPATTTSLNRPPTDDERSKRHHHETYKEKAKKDFNAAERRGIGMWDDMKERLFRPGVAGGLLGVVNIGLLATMGYKLYTEPHLRSDRRFLGWSTAGVLGVLGVEGFFAEAYRNTSQGIEEEKRARAEGASVYRHTKEIVLRPQVFGGLVGALNVGIIGCLSYIAYDNWDRYWDRRALSGITIGVLALIGGEGCVVSNTELRARADI
ncbi:hypothetical protein Clacol_000725 [Clathrus columnatus]|uniref:Uncharacterized protein n=1 Tax=Clathrus columnatus TaxID=1419009 RepID=A0AAV5A018_9AGAM|nr:hypothetical protein Clacol_000725 [Clathrus columnatus]